jgi:MFS transporter, MHS family, proline/betaine transporter
MAKKKKNVTIAAMIGTALEYYDMSLYGFMAPLLISIFLPTFDKINALILTFIFPIISLIVRPLGAIVIGKIGDTYGRKIGLIISIGGMTVATGIIGLLPTYNKIGVLAPILFVILRSLQGFFMAGEYNGGAILVLEHSPDHRKGYVSGLYCLYTVYGIAISAVICTITSYLPPQYWRIPYFIGCIAGIIGLYVRRHIHESPKFLESKHINAVPLKQIAKKYKLILISIGVVGLFSSLYTMPTLLMNSLLPLTTSYSLSTIMLINSATTILYMFTFPLFGRLADKISCYKSMSIAAVIVLITSYPLISMISYNKLEYIFIMKLCFALITAWFGAPFHAWIQSLFLTRERYAAISFSYAIGHQLGGLMVPLSLWSWKHTHSFFAIYSILIFWSAVALTALYYQRYLAKKDQAQQTLISRKSQHV